MLGCDSYGFLKDKSLIEFQSHFFLNLKSLLKFLSFSKDLFYSQILTGAVFYKSMYIIRGIKIYYTLTRVFGFAQCLDGRD